MIVKAIRAGRTRSGVNWLPLPYIDECTLQPAHSMLRDLDNLSQLHNPPDRDQPSWRYRGFYLVERRHAWHQLCDMEVYQTQR